MALPIPSSARERTERIFVKRPLTPRYSEPSIRTNMTLHAKPTTVLTTSPAIPVNIFIKEYSVLLLTFILNYQLCDSCSVRSHFVFLTQSLYFFPITNGKHLFIIPITGISMAIIPAHINSATKIE